MRLSSEGKKHLAELPEFILSIGSSTEGPPRKSGGPLQFASACTKRDNRSSCPLMTLSGHTATDGSTCERNFKS